MNHIIDVERHANLWNTADKTYKDRDLKIKA